LTPVSLKANILIDQGCHARLADFGLVTTVSGPSSGLTPSSSVQIGGTARWMSPEVLLENPPTKESDCYALGMVILEVLSDRVPFAIYGSILVVKKVLDGEQPERPKREWFTDDLWRTLVECWSSQPIFRPPVKDVLQLLERISKTWQPLGPNVDENNVDESRSTLSYYCEFLCFISGCTLKCLCNSWNSFPG
jgi:serine/threonine protein kinase